MKMKNIYKTVLFILLISTFIACDKSDNSTAELPRPFNEVYKEDIAEIEEFLNTHYVTYDADYNTVFAEIQDGGAETTIMQMLGNELTFKEVNTHGITYKVYYLKLREGVGESPTRIDSAYVAYEGFTFNKVQDATGDIITQQTVFDKKVTPVWFELEDVIRGWGEIIPQFKTGTSSIDSNTGEVTFSDFGAGVMFLPSGLAYYNGTTGSIAPYTPLVFEFKLHSLRYKDHDRDNILSKDEYGTDFNSKALDTDGDGYPDFLDPDDDGDGILTKNELTYDTNGNVIFPYSDCDNDGIPDYLDTSVCP